MIFPVRKVFGDAVNGLLGVADDEKVGVWWGVVGGDKNGGEFTSSMV